MDARIADLTDLSTLDGTEVVYTWQDPVTKLQYTFAVERMQAAIDRLKPEPIRVPIGEAHARFTRAARGLELHRLRRLRKAKKLDPILMAVWADGSVLTLDGNHRTVVAFERGRKWIAAYMMQPEFWTQFVVEIEPFVGMPKQSGIA